MDLRQFFQGLGENTWGITICIEKHCTSAPVLCCWTSIRKPYEYKFL